MKHAPNTHLCVLFQAALDVLARPWTGLVLATLAESGPLRFSALRARIPEMGDRMLSARLKELEARGLVARCVEPGPPVRVCYGLTETGRGFRDVAAALSAWGARILGKTPRAGRRRAA